MDFLGYGATFLPLLNCNKFLNYSLQNCSFGFSSRRLSLEFQPCIARLHPPPFNGSWGRGSGDSLFAFLGTKPNSQSASFHVQIASGQLFFATSKKCMLRKPASALTSPDFFKMRKGQGALCSLILIIQSETPNH